MYLSESHAYWNDSFYCHVTGRLTVNEANMLKGSSLSDLSFRCFIEFLRYYDACLKVIASLLYRLAVCVTNEMAGICFWLVGKSAEAGRSVSKTGLGLLSKSMKVGVL